MNAPAAGQFREVVLGRNSKVWLELAADARIAARFRTALSHSELAEFGFTPHDRIWIFAYSRNPWENSRIFERLAAARVAAVVYVTSASTIVSRVTDCYEYPRVKLLAEREARATLDARILTLGLVHRSPAELPGGINVATSLDSISEFMLDPSWPDCSGSAMHLFVPLRREFSGRCETWLHRLYGALQRLCGSWPCLLRPLDYLLRAAGFRWYGYIHLSNRLWYTTIS